MTAQNLNSLNYKTIYFCNVIDVYIMQNTRTCQTKSNYNNNLSHLKMNFINHYIIHIKIYTLTLHTDSLTVKDIPTS